MEQRTRTVCFVDPVTQAPYSARSLTDGGIGGTEATVIRVAQGLAKRGWDVRVEQKPRCSEEVDDFGVRYCSMGEHRHGFESAPQNIVLLRAYKLMKKVSSWYPNSKKTLWLHCFPGKRRRRLLSLAEKFEFDVLTVSHAHKAFVRRLCGGTTALDRRLKMIYNIVDVPSEPKKQQKKADKLVFFSSPHKGLDEVLRSFKAVRKTMPHLHLFVANPGYIKHIAEDTGFRADSQIEVLGSLSHAEVLSHVAEAFCVFYPQTTFAETFGLVFAESNALGTPVLAHDLGSAREVLTGDQIVDCTHIERVCEKLRQWRSHYPRVTAKIEFREENVIDNWERLLQGTTPL